jgi:multidrug resistance efflux pump
MLRYHVRALATLSFAAALGIALVYWLQFRNRHVTAGYAFVRGAVVQVGSPIDGQIAQVEVAPGQRVRHGDTLLRLDDTRQRARVFQSQAAVAQAKTQLEVERAALSVLYDKARILSGQLKAKVAVNESEARAAAIDAELATGQARRAKLLSDKQLVSGSDNEIAMAAEGVAKQKVQRARDRVTLANAELKDVALELSDADAHKARLQVLAAAVTASEAALKSAEAELAQCVVRAARDGIVSRRLVEPGAAVRVGATLFELWYDEALSIEAWIEESSYDALAIGAPATVRLTGLSSAPLRGRVDWLGVVSEAELKNASFSVALARQLAESRWIRARIALEDSDPRLLPGLTADVAIERRSPTVPLLPSSWSFRDLFPQASPPAAAANGGRDL